MTSSQVRGNNGNGVEVKSRRRNEQWGEGGGVQTDKGKSRSPLLAMRGLAKAVMWLHDTIYTRTWAVASFPGVGPARRVSSQSWARLARHTQRPHLVCCLILSASAPALSSATRLQSVV
jgi:hypothetical protein